MRADGDPDLPTREPERFGRLMLEWDLASYAAATAVEPQVPPGSDPQRLHFFDHAIPCLAGYYRLIGRPLPAGVVAAIREYRYQTLVFVAPPWRTIYRQDAEQRQTWREAQQVHAVLLAAYPACGYRLVDLPLAPVADQGGLPSAPWRGLCPSGPTTRIHHMMNSIDEGAGAAVTVDRLRVVRGGREVLPSLSLTVPLGQVVGLLGPSGGGKSTLMRAVVGVQQVAGGTVTVLGRPAGDPALRRRVAYVTQSPSVYGDLTVQANLRYFGRLLGLRGSALADDVRRVVDAVDLADHVGVQAGRLSGGQLSRVSLAAALLGQPELLVLDEPTVGLDPVLRRDLWQLFARLAADGTTLFVSSHVMDEATRCDRLLLLRDGRLLADESPSSLLDRTGAADAEEAFLRLIEAQGGPADRTEGALA